MLMIIVDWLIHNAGSIIVLLVLAGILSLIVIKILQDKKRGACSCSGCSGCTKGAKRNGGCSCTSCHTECKSKAEEKTDE